MRRVAGSPSLWFLLLALFLAGDRFLLGEWSFVRTHDEGNNLLPFRLSMALSVARDGLHAWVPQLAAGTDARATALDFDLDLPLFMWLPGWLAYGLIFLLLHWVAGYFAWKLLRDRLGAPALAAFAGGALMATAHFDLMQKLVVAGAPLVLFGLSVVRPGILLALAACAAGVAMALVSLPIYSPWLAPGIFLWLWLVERRTPVVAFVAGTLYVLGLVAVEWPTFWSVAVNGPLSYRAAHVFSSDWRGHFADQWAAFAQFRVWAPFLAGLGALVVGRGDRRLLLVLLAVTVLFHFGVPLWSLLVDLLGERAGALRGYNTRVWVNSPVWQSALLGLALARMAVLGGRWRWPAYGALAVIAAQVTVASNDLPMSKLAVAQAMIHGDSYAIKYRHPDLLALAARGRTEPPFRVGTWFGRGQRGGAMDPDYMLAYGFETVDGLTNIYSRRYHQFWQRVIAGIAPGNPERWQEFLTWGSRHYLFSAPEASGPECRPGEVEPCALRFAETYNLGLLSLANMRYLVSPRPLDDPRLVLLDSPLRQGLWDLAGQGATAKIRTLLGGDYVGVALWIYENRAALPRFFLASRVAVMADGDAVLDRLAGMTEAEMARTAVMAQADAAGLDAATIHGAGSVRVESYQPDRIVLVAEAAATALLVIANEFNPNWTARVNGQPARLFAADHAFQGVVVDAGQSRVELSYDPPWRLY